MRRDSWRQVHKPASLPEDPCSASPPRLPPGLDRDERAWQTQAIERAISSKPAPTCRTGVLGSVIGIAVLLLARNHIRRTGTTHASMSQPRRWFPICSARSARWRWNRTNRCGPAMGCSASIPPTMSLRCGSRRRRSHRRVERPVRPPIRSPKPAIPTACIDRIAKESPALCRLADEGRVRGKAPRRWSWHRDDSRRPKLPRCQVAQASPRTVVVSIPVRDAQPAGSVTLNGRTSCRRRRTHSRLRVVEPGSPSSGVIPCNRFFLLCLYRTGRWTQPLANPLKHDVKRRNGKDPYE